MGFNLLKTIANPNIHKALSLNPFFKNYSGASRLKLLYNYKSDVVLNSFLQDIHLDSCFLSVFFFF